MKLTPRQQEIIIELREETKRGTLQYREQYLEVIRKNQKGLSDTEIGKLTGTSGGRSNGKNSFKSWPNGAVKSITSWISSDGEIMNIGTKKKHKWILTEKIGPGLKTHCDIILRYMREIREGIKPSDITHELGMHCPGQNGERLYDLALTAFYTLETCGLIYADKSGRYYLVKDK